MEVKVRHLFRFTVGMMWLHYLATLGCGTAFRAVDDARPYDRHMALAAGGTPKAGGRRILVLGPM